MSYIIGINYYNLENIIGSCFVTLYCNNYCIIKKIKPNMFDIYNIELILTLIIYNLIIDFINNIDIKISKLLIHDNIYLNKKNLITLLYSNYNCNKIAKIFFYDNNQYIELKIAEYISEYFYNIEYNNIKNIFNLKKKKLTKFTNINSWYYYNRFYFLNKYNKYIRYINFKNFIKNYEESLSYDEFIDSNILTEFNNDLTTLNEINTNDLTTLNEINTNDLTTLNEINTNDLTTLKEINTNDLTTLKEINTNDLTTLNEININDLTTLNEININDLTTLNEININDLTTLKEINTNDLTTLNEININDLTTLNEININDLTTLNEIKKIKLKSNDNLDIFNISKILKELDIE